MRYLTGAQAQRLERLLRGRQRVLRDEIRAGLLSSDEQHHKDLAGMVADVGDESVANLLADLDVKSIDRDVGELRDVEAALERLARGVLGVCADCGGDIGYDRLEANPAATRCIRCQDGYERTHAHEGTPTL